MQRPKTAAGEGSAGHRLRAVKLTLLEGCELTGLPLPLVPVSLGCDLCTPRSHRRGKGRPFHIATDHRTRSPVVPNRRD